ncbi:MAG: sulfatase [Planctomycetes bacterium]|nr:sulfatase [Planctomycetota bacterium]
MAGTAYRLVIAAAAALVCGAGCAPQPQRPNVLLITIDTLRADHLGCYGYQRPTSPRIDAFAAGAVVFENAHSSSSWTLPSLASIHTSLYSTTHGCWKIYSRLEPEFTTTAEILRDAGYDTAMVACHIFLSAQYGLQQGFTHIDDELVRPPSDAAAAISSPGVTARGVRFLERQAASPDGAPWFLWLHYFDPHDTYLPHAGFSETFGTSAEIDLYDGEIAFTDHHVGEVLARLAELGLAEDTIVVLTADHGEEFGEHGFQRHGYTLYEEAVRIPLVVRAPGAPARRVSDVVSNVDLLPTILDLAGLPPPAARDASCAHGFEGRSLAPLVRGTGPLLPAAALSEVRWHDGQDLRAWRDGAWKLVEDQSTGQQVDQSALFDLATDPRERTDLREPESARLAALREAVTHRLARAMGWARCYPLVELYAPTPGDMRRLQDLGYAGDELPSSPEEGRR